LPTNNDTTPGRSKKRMKLIAAIDESDLENARLIAESSEFAVYDIGNDTYALVHRHEAVEWQAIAISGDGLFRVSELLVHATRELYRDVATEFSLHKRTPQ
jgi:hypothetical protein